MGYLCSESKNDEIPDSAQSQKGEFYLHNFKNSSFTQRWKNSMVGVEKVVIISVERSDFVRSQKGYVYYQPVEK